jgi:hypothetical protein
VGGIHSLTEMEAPLEVISCSVAEVKRSGESLFEHHSLLAGIAMLWLFVLAGTVIVLPLALTKWACCLVGRNSEQMFSWAIGIAIALGASAYMNLWKFGEWRHPRGCSRHCSFVAKVQRCMIEAKKVRAL